MFGAEVLADGAALCRLIVKMEFLAREGKRVGLDVSHCASCQARDNGRINATAQENADRDIANKLALYRRGEALADGRFQLVIGRVFEIRIPPHFPIALDRNGIVAQVNRKAVARLKLPNFAECSFRPRHVKVSEEIRDRTPIHVEADQRGCKNRLDFRTKKEMLRRRGIK